MTSSPVIRQSLKEDIPMMIPLVRSYVADFYRRPDPGVAATERFLEMLVREPHAAMQFVATIDDRIVGFATLYFTFSTLQMKRAAILNDLFVVPDMRGRGVGEALFKHCHRHIQERGFAYMQWETEKSNVVAQSLYRKMGGHVSDWVVYEIE